MPLLNDPERSTLISRFDPIVVLQESFQYGEKALQGM